MHFIHFIKVQSLDMFRALIAHLQETLHECRFDDLCEVVDVGWSQGVERLYYPKHVETLNLNKV
jgi:hypothetical protein